jgi:hypothetical protein
VPQIQLPDEEPQARTSVGKKNSVDVNVPAPLLGVAGGNNLLLNKNSLQFDMLIIYSCCTNL